MYKKIFYSFLLLFLLIAPFIGVYPIFIIKVLCFSLFAASFNLLIGYTGLLSIGHAAFFGGAGYIAGYTMKAWGLTPELGIFLGVMAGALIGLIMGGVAIRRQGIYFAMITLAMAQMLYFFFLQAPFTGGEDGLQGIPRGKLFGLIDLSNDLTVYFFIVSVVILGFLFIARIIDSPFGRILQAIKENEPRALSLGYNVGRFKLIIFVISAALAGLAGSLKTLLLGFSTLTDVAWTMSGSVILMTLVGGMGTFSGPLVGALIVVSLENELGQLGSFFAEVSGIDAFNIIGESVTTVTGLIFMLCVLAFRRGVVGELLAYFKQDTRS